MAKKNKIEIGIAGEYYAAGKLSIEGYKVSMTPGNTKGIDLFVADGNKAKMIQVKTTEGPKSEWVVPRLTEANPNFLFVFVNLNPKKDCSCHSFHIVPSSVVKKQLDKKDAEYKEKQKKAGKQVKEGAKGVCRFDDFEGKYLNAWKHIG